MARLPRYDSKLEMSTQAPNVMRDMEAEQRIGRSVATMGKAAKQIADVWQTSLIPFLEFVDHNKVQVRGRR